MAIEENELLAQAAKNIIKNVSPTEWICFLFELQNNSIASEEVGTFSETGAADYSFKFSELKLFLQNVNSQSGGYKKE